jgi:hypothetical protein
MCDNITRPHRFATALYSLQLLGEMAERLTLGPHQCSPNLRKIWSLSVAWFGIKIWLCGRFYNLITGSTPSYIKSGVLYSPFRNEISSGGVGRHVATCSFKVKRKVTCHA